MLNIFILCPKKIETLQASIKSSVTQIADASPKRLVYLLTNFKKQYKVKP